MDNLAAVMGSISFICILLSILLLLFPDIVDKVTHKKTSRKEIALKATLPALVVFVIALAITPSSAGHAPTTAANEASRHTAVAPAKNATASDVKTEDTPKIAARGESCDEALCEPGSTVKLSIGKGDMAYMCDTEATAQYVNAVFSFAAAQVIVTGKVPQISPDTGEPEFSGETAALVDNLRTAAGVKTLDEGVSKCEKGKNGQAFTVMNSAKSKTLIWVTSRNGNTLWGPNSNMIRQ